MDKTTTVGFLYDEDGFVTEPKFVEDNVAIYVTALSELEELCLPSEFKLIACNYSQAMAEAILDKCREALELNGITACGFLTTTDGLLVISSDRETVFPMKQGAFKITTSFPIDNYEEDNEDYDYLRDDFEYAKVAKYSK